MEFVYLVAISSVSTAVLLLVVLTAIMLLGSSRETRAQKAMMRMIDDRSDRRQAEQNA